MAGRGSCLAMALVQGIAMKIRCVIWVEAFAEPSLGGDCTRRLNLWCLGQSVSHFGRRHTLDHGSAVIRRRPLQIRQSKTPCGLVEQFRSLALPTTPRPTDDCSDTDHGNWDKNAGVSRELVSAQTLGLF